MSLESTEQDLLKDVLSVKNAVVENWEEIQKNATKIEGLIADGFTWLDTNLENEIKTLKKDASAIEKELKDFTISTSLKNDINRAESKFGPPLDTVIQNLEGAEDLSDILKIIKDAVSSIDKIPTDITSALKPIKNIMCAILGGGFSIALKDIPSHKVSGDGEGDSTDSESPEGDAYASPDFLNTLLSSLNFDIFFTNNEAKIEAIIAKMAGTPAVVDKNGSTTTPAVPGVITDADITALEGPISKMISNLKALPTNGITVEALLMELQTLLDGEKATVENILTSLFTEMTDDFACMKTMANDLLTDSNIIVEGSELHELYKDITGCSTPTLLEIISILISVPFTLISNIAEFQFPFPDSAFPLAKKNSRKSSDAFENAETSSSIPLKEDEKEKMEASLTIVKTVYLCIDKLMDYQMEKRGLSTPYQYKFLSGAIESVFTLIEQVISYEGVSVKKASWIANWVTDFGYFLSKSMVDGYMTKNIDSYKTSNILVKKLQTYYDTFFTNYEISLETINELNNKTYYQIQKYITTSNFRKINGGGYNFKRTDTSVHSNKEYLLCSAIKSNVENITTDNKINSVINAIDKISISTDKIDEIIKNLKDVKVKLTGKHYKNSREKIDDQVKEFESCKVASSKPLDLLKSNVKNISLSSDFKKAENNRDKLLNAIYPGVGLSIQALNRVWTVYLYEEQNTNDTQTLIYDLINGFQFVAGNISSIYYYRNPQEEGSNGEAHKERIGYILFGATIFFNMNSAITKLT